MQTLLDGQFVCAGPGGRAAVEAFHVTLERQFPDGVSGTYSVEFMVPPPFDKLGLDEAGAGLPFNAVDIKTN